MAVSRNGHELKHAESLNAATRCPSSARAAQSASTRVGGLQSRWAHKRTEGSNPPPPETPLSRRHLHRTIIAPAREHLATVVAEDDAHAAVDAGDGLAGGESHGCGHGLGGRGGHSLLRSFDTRPTANVAVAGEHAPWPTHG